jgi:hypothetical protein
LISSIVSMNSYQMMFYWFLKYFYVIKKHYGQKNWSLVMPAKFWQTIVRFWIFLSYLITTVNNIFTLMRGSSHSRSVLIGVKYRTLDVVILIGHIQSKPIYKLVAYIPSSPLVTSPLSNFDWIFHIQIAKHK